MARGWGLSLPGIRRRLSWPIQELYWYLVSQSYPLAYSKRALLPQHLQQTDVAAAPTVSRGTSSIPIEGRPATSVNTAKTVHIISMDTEHIYCLATQVGIICTVYSRISLYIQELLVPYPGPTMGYRYIMDTFHKLINQEPEVGLIKNT